MLGLCFMARNRNSLMRRVLLAVHSASLFQGFGEPGKILRQDRPYCCGREVDLEKTTVCLENIKIGGRKFVVLAPYCPICGRKIPPKLQVTH